MSASWHKTRTLAAKALVDFIRAHPGGVTAEDARSAGLALYCVGRLLSLGLISAEQVRDPQRGKRSYHWLWKPTAPSAASRPPAPRSEGARP